MKLNINSHELSNVLQIAIKSISNKPAMPILENLVFKKIDDEHYSIATSDMEKRIEILMNGDYEGEPIAINAKRLTDLCNSLSKDEEIFISSLNDTCSIVWSTGNMSIPCFDIDEYPQMQDVLSNEVVFPQIEIKNALSITIPAISDDTLRAVLTGIYFDITKDKTTIVGTNGFALVTYSLQSNDTNSTSFILPCDSASIINKALSEKGMVSILSDGKNAKFIIDNITITSRLIDGKYPNYNSVIPRDNNIKVTTNRLFLCESIKRLVTCVKTQSTLSLLIGNNAMEIRSSDLYHNINMSETIKCDYQGEPISICFNATHLLTALNCASNGDIELLIKDSIRPVLIQSKEDLDTCTIIVVPIRKM